MGSCAQRKVLCKAKISNVSAKEKIIELAILRAILSTAGGFFLPGHLCWQMVPFYGKASKKNKIVDMYHS